MSLERPLGRARVWGCSGERVLIAQVQLPLGPRCLWTVPLWGRHPVGGVTKVGPPRSISQACGVKWVLEGGGQEAGDQG